MARTPRGAWPPGYDDIGFGPDEPTHDVVQAYARRLAEPLDLPLDHPADQAWLSLGELLAHSRVHPHTPAYFQGT